jgi:hypothetical protein
LMFFIPLCCKPRTVFSSLCVNTPPIFQSLRNAPCSQPNIQVRCGWRNVFLTLFLS